MAMGASLRRRWPVSGAMGTWGKVLRCDNSPMIVERNVPLQPLNSFGIAARAAQLVRVRSEADVHAVLADAGLALQGALDLVVDEPGQFLERHVGRGDGEGLDRLAFHVDLGDDRLLDGGGQVAADAVDGVLDVLQRLVRRLFDLEEHGRHGAAVGDGRHDVIDALDAGDRVLDLLGDLHLELGRGGAALRHRNGDDRHVDIGKARDGQRIKG